MGAVGWCRIIPVFMCVFFSSREDIFFFQVCFGFCSFFFGFVCGMYVFFFFSSVFRRKKQKHKSGLSLSFDSVRAGRMDVLVAVT